MNPLLYMLEGAGILAAAYSAYVIARKTWVLGHSIVSALSGVPKLIESNQRVATQLELLVGLLTGQSPNFGVDPSVPADPGQPRPPMMPRPDRPWDTFTPVTTEAEESDTEIYDTSEAELIQYEQLDEIRARGFSVEADLDVNPAGVTKNAE